MKRHPLLIAGLLLASLLGSFVQAQTLNFNLETSSSDGRTVVPRLVWSTTPAASSCTASGATDWTGTKAASGTVTLAAVNASRTFTLVCNWPGVSVAAVGWTAPALNVDGTPYTNAAGYRIQYGTSPSALTESVYVQNPAARSWTSPALAAGTWHFGVRAVNALGLESDLSNVASKATTAGVSRTVPIELAIRFPTAPVLTVE
jgi:hypothetical protein